MFLDEYGEALDDFNSESAKRKNNITWSRPGRGEGLMDGMGTPKLFGELQPSDVHQGSLGDCWLIGAMAALCEFPDVLEKVFITKEWNEEGRYEVRLLDIYNPSFFHELTHCKQSSVDSKFFKTIIVDDRFPCKQRTGYYPQLCFAQPTATGEIWPMILEKAIAALAGGYNSIGHGGQPVNAFTMMAGSLKTFLYQKESSGKWSRTTSWNHKSRKLSDFEEVPWPNLSREQQDDEYFFECLKTWDGFGFLMSVFNMSLKGKQSNGLVGGHAYSVLRVELDVAGSGWDLIQVRNPWGHHEWNGRWSDSSSSWDEYPAVKDALNPTEDDDGAFWMCKSDFFENFGGPSCYLGTCEDFLGRKRASSGHLVRRKQPRHTSSSFLDKLDANSQIDFMFSCFDVDQNGYLNLPEMIKYQAELCENITEEMWPAMCESEGVNPAQGFSKAHVRAAYQKQGGPAKDFNIITSKMRTRLDFIFDYADRDSDGYISLKEFCMLMGEETDEAEWVELCGMLLWDPGLGANRDGFRDFFAKFAPAGIIPLFEETVKTKSDMQQKIVSAFNAYDKDGNGKLSHDELILFLQDLDVRRWSRDKCSQIISVMDVNNDGHIQVEEFVYWALGRPASE
eukprot:TRINITY_DN24041_c1_g1_i1.p1 TRINITY_DN24041_c1_g1~~TRINITY_DN24041_c1_g1_i1.p1  ORF type:complete len:621 (-),score=104.04 TRINITY_DN24041_c1_g1_i1:307-2169(-)